MYGNLYNNNPYQTALNGMQYNQQSHLQPQQSNYFGMKQQVIRVNGKNGAEAYQLPPNSSILLLDETAPIVWLKMTDGAGYPTLTPYDIAPHQSAEQLQQIDMKSLDERIKKLEDIVNEFSESNVEPSQPVTRRIITAQESK